MEFTFPSESPELLGLPTKVIRQRQLTSVGLELLKVIGEYEVPVVELANPERWSPGWEARNRKPNVIRNIVSGFRKAGLVRVVRTQQTKAGNGSGKTLVIRRTVAGRELLRLHQQLAEIETSIEEGEAERMSA